MRRIMKKLLSALLAAVLAMGALVVPAVAENADDWYTTQISLAWVDINSGEQMRVWATPLMLGSDYHAFWIQLDNTAPLDRLQLLIYSETHPQYVYDPASTSFLSEVKWASFVGDGSDLPIYVKDIYGGEIGWYHLYISGLPAPVGQQEGMVDLMPDASGSDGMELWGQMPEMPVLPQQGVAFVHVVGAANGMTLYEEHVTCTSDLPTLITAHWIDGYQVVGADSYTVTVDIQGQANYPQICFQYAVVENATPVPQRGVADVRVIGAVDGMVLYEEYTTCTSDAPSWIIARPIEGYQIVGSDSYMVQVDANGTPDHAEIWFTYAPAATPTPVPTVEPTPVPTAEPTPVPTAVPTPEPTAVPTVEPTQEPLPVSVIVPVLMIGTDGTILKSFDLTCTEGIGGWAYAELFDGWNLIGANSVPITVYPAGYAEPSNVVFNYERVVIETPVPTEVPTPEPTAVPTVAPTATPTLPPLETPTMIPVPTEVPVTPEPEPAQAEVAVVMQAKDGLILNASSVICREGEENVIRADSIDGWQLISDSAVAVQVNPDGTVDPGSVVFTYEQIPVETPVPAAKVTIRYVNNDGEAIAPADVMELNSGVYAVEPMTAAIPEEYRLTGENAYSVSVSGGKANPDEVVFTYEIPVVNGRYTLNFVDERGLNICMPVIVELPGGRTTTVDPSEYVPAGYEPFSAAPVAVTVTRQGRTTPDDGTFVYRPAVVETPVPAGSYVNRYGVVNDKQVAMRSSMNTSKNSNILDRLNKGTQVWVIQLVDGEWANILYNGVEAYMKSSFIDVMTQLESDKLEHANGVSMPRYPMTTATPTAEPTMVPTAGPTILPMPTEAVSIATPSEMTMIPMPTETATAAPAVTPTMLPVPTEVPTTEPTAAPTAAPTMLPVPTEAPTAVPTAVPTAEPTMIPIETVEATMIPVPTMIPATPVPTSVPTMAPTAEPVPTLIPANGQLIVQATQVPEQYYGYAVTKSRTALRSEVSNADSTLMGMLEEGTLLYLSGQAYDANGSAWSYGTTLNNHQGYVSDTSLSRLSDAQAQGYIDAYNASIVTPTTVPHTTAEPLQQQGYAYTIGSNVLFRDMASSMANIKNVLPADTVVYVYGQQYDQGVAWHIVQYNGGWGYIRSDMLHMMSAQEQYDFLANMTATATPEPQATPQAYNPSLLSSYGYVTTKVNFRSAPSTGAARVDPAELYPYALCLITGSEVVNGENWYHVNYGATEGYILGKYFKRLTISELDRFLNSKEYQQGITANTRTTSSSAGTSTQTTYQPSNGRDLTAEDQTVGQWNNSDSGVYASYAPFDPFATPEPLATEAPIATLAPNATTPPKEQWAAFSRVYTKTGTTRREIQNSAELMTMNVAGLIVADDLGTEYTLTDSNRIVYDANTGKVYVSGIEAAATATPQPTATNAPLPTEVVYPTEETGSSMPLIIAAVLVILLAGGGYGFFRYNDAKKKAAAQRAAAKRAAAQRQQAMQQRTAQQAVPNVPERAFASSQQRTQQPYKPYQQTGQQEAIKTAATAAVDPAYTAKAVDTVNPYARPTASASTDSFRRPESEKAVEENAQPTASSVQEQPDEQRSSNADNDESAEGVRRRRRRGNN